MLGFFGGTAYSAPPVRVVVSFSVLADLVHQVGGDRVRVDALVGPNGDAHTFSPAPADARRVAQADLIVVNGLGLEGWMDRLIRASGAKAPIAVASRGVRPKPADQAEIAEHGPGHAFDPHAWQDVENAEIYVRNIRDGLIGVDPAGKATYAAAADRYLAVLAALDRDIRAGIAMIPPARRKVITTHDAFGYYQRAYGIRFIAPEGISTETEASPRDVARIIGQIKAEHIPAVFLENISDNRLTEQIARETGARIGGEVYSDALSGPDGPAATYVAMMRHNLAAFIGALASADQSATTSAAPNSRASSTR
jgi:zinc/manganese transport system substrate-binding protein